jgi:hypothetical protein
MISRYHNLAGMPFVLALLTIGVLAVAAQPAAAQQADFDLGFDAGDRIGEATTVSPEDFWEGEGHLEYETDDKDAYFLPGEPSVCYIWLGEIVGGGGIVCELRNSEGDLLDDFTLYGLQNSNAFYISEYAGEDFYIIVRFLYQEYATYYMGFSY